MKAKETVLNHFLYGVHKEAIKKHHAFEKCIHDAMEDYAKHVTTSQEQTIERLREFILDAKRMDDFGDRYRLTQHLKKTEQLLNTTEPIDQ